MRNVKVVVNADTSQAIGKVRELTGALAQLDAATKRNVQYLLSNYGGKGLAPKVIGGFNSNQNIAAQARFQGQSGGMTVGLGNSQNSEQRQNASETMNRLNKSTLVTAGKQFNLFSDDLTKVFSTAFSSLFEDGLKSALSLYHALKKSDSRHCRKDQKFDRGQSQNGFK
jgi:hypothetical protein